MLTRIKALGIAVLALTAIGVTMASAAQAGEFTAENFTATVTGTALAKHEFKFNGGTISCTVASFDGKLAGPAENLTIAAEYGNCRDRFAAGCGATGSKVRWKCRRSRSLSY
jgi:hypothetical protein